MSWTKKRSHYPTWEGLSVCTRLYIFTLPETLSFPSSFSFWGLVLLLLLLLLLFGSAGWFWCRIISDKEWLSKDEQSWGTKTPTTHLNSQGHCFPELEHSSLLLAQRFPFSSHEEQPCTSVFAPQQKRVTALLTAIQRQRIKNPINGCLSKCSWSTDSVRRGVQGNSIKEE